LPREGLLLARDVERSIKRLCPNGEVAGAGTIIPPPLSPELKDLVQVSFVEPLHARARLEQRLKAAPTDPALRRAALFMGSDAETALAALPFEPFLHQLRIAALSGHVRAVAALAYVNLVLPKTIEAPRGLGVEIGAVLRLADSDDPAWNEVAAGLLRACSIGNCAELSLATARLRRSDVALLAEKGVALANDALVRLDVIVALVAQKKLAPAMKLRAGMGSAAEASLADAVITAGNGNCTVAKAAMTKAMTLKTSHADVFARIAKNCP
jgi:hypothetical protein